MSDRVLLRGFGFSGFRSVDVGEVQRFGPMEKVHVLAGPNNSGKSNALRVATNVLPALKDAKPPVLDALDWPRRGGSTAVMEGLRVSILSQANNQELANVSAGVGPDAIRRVLGETDLWFEFELTALGGQRRWNASSHQA